VFEVTNQPPPLESYNLLRCDAALSEALVREGAGWAEAEMAALGDRLGRPETIALGFDANRHPPQLKIFDRYGHRIDEVEFHPAWHELMAIAVRAGLHCRPWADPRPGAHVARAAGVHMLVQVEAGVFCPIAMTFGSVPTLAGAPRLAPQWLPRIFGRHYDRRCQPAADKTSALIGMAMTENQGGSDLRSNACRAEPAAADGQENGQVFRLSGHKWFMSAPMCDAFLVLAQAPGGLSCFLVPRFTPDGRRNGVHLLRLKDKLGNRSNASSEVEFIDAHAELIGEQGRGIPTIIEMANHTRLDCTIGSAGLMRQAVAQAIHHARHRIAFQKKLVDHGLMTNVLADLALESEAATALALRLARAYDESDEASLAFRRVITPAAKFWVCKRACYLAEEAMEVLGGSGYIEECTLPRIYREMPVNSIWEGSGNIMCLDVLRAVARLGPAAELLLADLAEAGRSDDRLAASVDRLRPHFAAAHAGGESEARAITRDLIIAVQAALLIRHAPAPVAEAFCASRLAGDTSTFGLLPRGIDLHAIVERAAPVLH
jgi:putative acyl-CoA dehydrogenase